MRTPTIRTNYYYEIFIMRIRKGMRYAVLLILSLSHFLNCHIVAQTYQTFLQQMERLDRGVVALPAQDKGIFVSWRLLGTDEKGTTFDLLRDGKTIAKGLTITNFTDVKGSSASRYSVVTHLPSATSPLTSAEMTAWPDLYRSIPLDRPEGGTTPDGRPYQYRPNDCSVGDVDGDGQYELFLKWDPSNAHDNAHDGYTGDVIIDCLKLDGTKLWRINLGKNIRAGAHYTQFMVYDFDRDGHAELICKTAPGSMDGTGRYVTEAADDDEIRKDNNQADYRNERGRILSGPEYLTVFNGQTGRAIHTIYYRPNRAFGVGGAPLYDKEGWGDRSMNGNRGERFLAGVAWLNGPDSKPSAIMCRGYYTPSHLWAVDFDGQKLTTRWLHASTTPHDYYVIDHQGQQTWYHDLKATAYGQGAHSLSVGDVDGDGCDEITYGSAAINNDGTLLYSTGLGHGDALHLSDLDPDRPGLEAFMVHESRPYFGSFVEKWDGEKAVPLPLSNGQHIADLGHSASCNWTKATPCLQADIFGDWREEVILWDASDAAHLNIFTTNIPTPYAVPTLMHDNIYRLSICWQNTAYNQPPHLGYYLPDYVSLQSTK